jgi:hypothetical protein
MKKWGIPELELQDIDSDTLFGWEGDFDIHRRVLA